MGRCLCLGKRQRMQFPDGGKAGDKEKEKEKIGEGIFMNVP